MPSPLWSENIPVKQEARSLCRELAQKGVEIELRSNQGVVQRNWDLIKGKKVAIREMLTIKGPYRTQGFTLVLEGWQSVQLKKEQCTAPDWDLTINIPSSDSKDLTEILAREVVAKKRELFDDGVYAYGHFSVGSLTPEQRKECLEQKIDEIRAMAEWESNIKKTIGEDGVLHVELPKGESIRIDDFADLLACQRELIRYFQENPERVTKGRQVEEIKYSDERKKVARATLHWEIEKRGEDQYSARVSDLWLYSQSYRGTTGDQRRADVFACLRRELGLGYILDEQLEARLTYHARSNTAKQAQEEWQEGKKRLERAQEAYLRFQEEERSRPIESRVREILAEV